MEGRFVDPNRPRMGSHAGPAAQGRKGEKSKRKKRQRTIKVKFKGESGGFDVERNQGGKFERPMKTHDLLRNMFASIRNPNFLLIIEERVQTWASLPSLRSSVLLSALLITSSPASLRRSGQLPAPVHHYKKIGLQPQMRDRLIDLVLTAQRPVPSTSLNQTGVIRASNPFSLASTSRAGRARLFVAPTPLRHPQLREQAKDQRLRHRFLPQIYPGYGAL
ncbi:hypothetical protein GALMADRAFT_213423 [Galerina marginata CBS 339.88]|uniref:Uncharacterized protein n=1 Tax=Galerina marginata (strain CBS 339.88) TaxID=685588 RepID=A0A067SNH0_GALM3|nr:hypothetical protein GALMADRAFT_213423 [Galerina marginata CBS 339.88]